MPGGSIPQLNGSWYDTKANYNFFKNEDIKIDYIKKALSSFGVTQTAGLNTVLVAHDMSNISFNKLQAKDLGYLDNKDGRGIMCFSSIAIDPEGIPIALLHQHTWTRPIEELGKSANRKTTAFEEKESYEWKRGIIEVNNIVG